VGSRSSGRRPRPTHLRALEGVRESRLNRDEPLPSDGLIVPPVQLTEAAQAIWNRLAPDMIAKRILTAWDVDEFANGCRMQAILNDALLEVETAPALVSSGSNNNLVMNPAIRIVTSLEASLRSIWSRFGLSPADRATLRIDHSGPSTGDEGYVS
jgi:P27 family predicted phage terminase small subunit